MPFCRFTQHVRLVRLWNINDISDSIWHWCSALLGAVEGKTWSTATRLDSAEATTPMVRNELYAAGWFTQCNDDVKCKRVTGLTHQVQLSFSCICFLSQPTGTLWRRCSMEWREAQRSWSARPGLLMCPSNGIFRRRTVTGDERFVAFPNTHIHLVDQTHFIWFWLFSFVFMCAHDQNMYTPPHMKRTTRSNACSFSSNPVCMWFLKIISTLHKCCCWCFMLFFFICNTFISVLY